ncbi:MAG: glycosyltransferase family 4 protein, partial [Planctomycetota bacterium]|nr:glycosyltransferase family 4 protein [Planctomycetota bacterium]
MTEHDATGAAAGGKRLRLVATDFHLDWGGQAAVVHLLCRHFRAAGCEVAVAAPEGSELAKRSQESGLATVPGLRFLPGFRPWSFWRDFGILRRYFRRFAPHIIHVHGSQDSWLAALANRAVGAAVVKTKHNTRPVRQHIFNRWLYRALCQRCVA